MRLSDHLMAECGGAVDVGGIFTKTCAAIREAERFELSDDVAKACYNLTKSKPTTLLGALPLSRAPYRKLWLEWKGGLTSGMVKPENKRDPAWAPDPLKAGLPDRDRRERPAGHHDILLAAQGKTGARRARPVLARERRAIGDAVQLGRWRKCFR